MSSRRNGLKNIGLLMKEDVVQSPRRLLNQGRHIDWQDLLPRELKVSNPRTDSPRIFHDVLTRLCAATRTESQELFKVFSSVGNSKGVKLDRVPLTLL